MKYNQNNDPTSNGISIYNNSNGTGTPTDGYYARGGNVWYSTSGVLSGEVACYAGTTTTTTTTTTTAAPSVVNITVNYESANNLGNITSLEIIGNDGTGYPVTITSGTFPLTTVGQSVTATTPHYDGEYTWDTDYPNGVYAPVLWEVRLYYNNIGGAIDKTIATRNGTESVCFGLSAPSGPGATQFGFSALNLGDNIVIEAKAGIC